MLAEPSLAGADSDAEAAPVSEEPAAVEVRVVMAEVLLPPVVGYGAVELAITTAVVLGTGTVKCQ